MSNARRASTMSVATWAMCGSLLPIMPHALFALASPTLTGLASTPALVGGSLTDTATLAGGASPTGTITFKLYNGCGEAGPPVILTSVKTVTGNGSYTSDPFSPLANNTFYGWQSSYSGDANNNPTTASSVCNGSESVYVPQYCAPPPSCPVTTGSCGTVTETTTTSTLTCTDTSPHVTAVAALLIGPATLCVGDDKSSSFFLCSGAEDNDTLVENVTVNVAAVPTLSIWGLVALVAGLGALALRRL
jgi:IPTL-CTERM motif